MQIHDATESVKQIGLAATLVIVLLGTIGLILRWAAKRLDKKDDQLLKIKDERHEDLSRMVESQKALVDQQKELSRGQEKIADALTTLADEIRREPRKQR